jgi:glucose/arabinose dehydrogenase
MGYDMPPEYFSKVTKGSFHGMPWYQFDGEKMIPDECADFDEPPRPIEDVSIPVAIFPAHNAPLDVLFINKSANAKEYYGDAVVALHGSWVKSTGTAFGDDSSLRHPKLALVKFENGEAKEVVDLLSGFQFADGSRWARPAGLAIGPDGDIYFSSDKEVQGLFRLRKVID